MTPGHEALEIVRELVSWGMGSPTFRLAAASSPRLQELYERARGVVIVAEAADTAMRPREVDARWCGPCRSFHAKSFPAGEALERVATVKLGGGS